MTDRVTEARQVALRVLTEVTRGELADRALARAGEGLDPRDHAWAQELVYGTIRLRGRLDYLLERFVRGGLASLQPVVLDILRLGAYQLVEMGGVPAYAAVSQSVELSREAGAPRAAGLVNGVLQALRREGEAVAFPDFNDDPIGYLTSWGSHPRWLVERWVERWGAEEARALVEANNRRPELYLTPIGISIEGALAELADAGVGAERVPGFPDSVRIQPSVTPARALAVVPAVVQDPAAAIIPRFAEAPADSRIVDLSAAPGGKTVGFAVRARYVVAADLSVGRLRRVRSNVERVGVGDRVGLVVADGREPPFREVDLVLLDAPCAGTGTLRRHADGRWRITEEDLHSLASLQRDLLGAAAAVVKPGGFLVYSTCSLEPEENEERVDEFLRDHANFRIVAPAAPFEGTMTDRGFLQILPQRHGVDGAFAARMQRVERS